MFSYISPEKRVPADHPLRPVRETGGEVLKEMPPRLARVYARLGRPSIAPECLLQGLLLQIFYSIRSGRLLMEQLNYYPLFRWLVGMEMDEEVWNHARSFQYRRTANFLAMATLATALPRRNFRRK